MAGMVVNITGINKKTEMTFNYSTKKQARITGSLYLVVVLTGIFSLAYVPNKLIVWDNPVLTFDNIVQAEQLFRLGIICSIICYVTYIFLSIAFYKLLKGINKSYATIMVLLVLISVPVALINLQNKLSILPLIGQKEYLKILSGEQLRTKVMFLLDQYNYGIEIASIFWGLWLLPLGYLVYKSNILPKLLGILLMLGCFGYLINIFGDLLFKNYSDLGISTYISLPASIGEIGLCLWLLIVGAK